MSHIAAYKTPFPLAVSLTPHSAMSLQRSLASNTPAMASTFKAPKFYTHTCAVNHTGFPPLLTEMLTKAFGCKASPDYLVFQSAPVPHLHRFDARVHISLGPAVDG